MALKLKRFSQPDLLKRIDPHQLLELFHPYRPFFEMKQFDLPDEGGDCDFLRLAGILAQPDEEMPSDLVEALHLIATFADDDRMSELLELAKQVALDVPANTTAADLATRILLRDRRVLEKKDLERLIETRRKYESYVSADPGLEVDISSLPSSLAPLEAALDAYFQSKKKGPGCPIIRKDYEGEICFLVQHGQTCRREPSRQGAQSTSTFYRPEKVDVVILDSVHNELRINAANAGDGDEYRSAFGLHLFGDENRFVYRPKYTLEPLKRVGAAALSCKAFPEIESVTLSEIEYSWGGAFDHVEIHRASNLFRALAILNRAIEKNAHIRRATFSIKLQGEKKVRKVNVRAGNTTGYSRGDEAAVVEDWLREQRFVTLKETGNNAQAEEFVASA